MTFPNHASEPPQGFILGSIPAYARLSSWLRALIVKLTWAQLNEQRLSGDYAVL